MWNNLYSFICYRLNVIHNWVLYTATYGSQINLTITKDVLHIHWIVYKKCTSSPCTVFWNNLHNVCLKQKFGKSKICILITNSMADPIPCVLSCFSYYETYMECYNVLLKYQPIKTGQKDKAMLLKVVSNNKQTKYWIESILPLVLLNNHISFWTRKFGMTLSVMLHSQMINV